MQVRLSISTVTYKGPTERSRKREGHRSSTNLYTALRRLVMDVPVRAYPAEEDADQSICSAAPQIRFLDSYVDPRCRQSISSQPDLGRTQAVVGSAASQEIWLASDIGNSSKVRAATTSLTLEVLPTDSRSVTYAIVLCISHSINAMSLHCLF